MERLGLVSQRVFDGDRGEGGSGGKIGTKRRLLNALFVTIGPMNAVRQIEWGAIVRLLEPECGELVLDAACGIGLLSLRLANRGSAVLGIDASREALVTARSILEARDLACAFSIQDAERLACSNGVFDKVVSSSSLEHFQNDEAALGELMRVLKPGGILVLTCDSLAFRISDRSREIHRQRAKVVNYYSLEEITTKLRRWGFQVEYASYVVRSTLSTVVYRVGIALAWTGLLWAVVSVVAYPFCAISDRIAGRDGQGQTVIVRARKPVSR